MAANRDLVPVTARELRDGDRDGSLMVGRRVVGTPRELASGRLEVTVRWGSTGRTEKLRIDPEWSGRVRRQTVGTGLALRHRSKARTTRGTVEVWDTSHPDSPVKADEVRGHQWAMRCEHGTAVGRQTLKLAREDVTDPRLWCLSCVEPVRGALPLPLAL